MKQCTFITFNTLAQAKNYIKRHRPSFFSGGCGCCWRASEYIINDKRVLYVSKGEHYGGFYINCEIIGKIKRS